MSFDIVTMKDCASNYGVFEVEGKEDSYVVSLSGSEGMAYCTCLGYKYRGQCKHIDVVWQQACMYNPQWHEGNSSPSLRPRDYTYTQFAGEDCPSCGGPTVFVKRAV